MNTYRLPGVLPALSSRVNSDNDATRNVLLNWGWMLVKGWKVGGNGWGGCLVYWKMLKTFHPVADVKV